MKRFSFLAVVAAVIVIFSYCSSTKKASSTPMLTYADNIQSLVTTNCSPCHFPDKGGNKKPLTNYESVRSTIDDIVHRIELHPGDKGFMPFKRARLSDSAINVFKQWKADGMREN